MFAHCEHVCVCVCVYSVCIENVFSARSLFPFFIIIIIITPPLTRHSLSLVRISYRIYILARSVCAPRVYDRLRQCRFLRCPPPPPPPSRMQIHSGEVCLNSVQRVPRLAFAAHVYVLCCIYIYIHTIAGTYNILLSASTDVYCEKSTVSAGRAQTSGLKLRKQVRNVPLLLTYGYRFP